MSLESPKVGHHLAYVGCSRVHGLEVNQVVAHGCQKLIVEGGPVGQTCTIDDIVKALYPVVKLTCGMFETNSM